MRITKAKIRFLFELLTQKSHRIVFSDLLSTL